MLCKFFLTSLIGNNTEVQTVDEKPLGTSNEFNY